MAWYCKNRTSIVTVVMFGNMPVLFIALPLLISTGIPVMYCLLEVVSVCPEKLAPRFVDKIDWIKVSISFIYVFI